MRLKTLPADLSVVEQLRARPLSRGAHAIYRVRKHNRTTLHAQTQVARRLHVSQPDVVFPEDTSPSRVGLDDMFQGRRKLSVGFVLPRGTYAPLVIRALVESPH